MSPEPGSRTPAASRAASRVARPVTRLLAALRADAAVGVVALLLATLLAWHATLVALPGALSGLVFLLGPFLGLGVALTLVADPPESPTTFAYFALVNALVAVTALGAACRYLPLIPFSTVGLVAAFDAVFLAVLGALWTVRRERLRAVPRPTLTPQSLAVGAAGLAVVVGGALAFVTKGVTGTRIPTTLLTLWVLGAFVYLYLRYPADRGVHVAFVATAGVFMTFSQALSSPGLMAVDGLSSVRLVRALVSDVDTAIFSERLYHNFAIGGLLPGLSFLSGWSPFRVAKYFLPALGGLSLVGIYRLTRTWLDARAAFVAAFLLSFQFPFLVELTTSYRTSLAFPVIVGFFLALAATDDRRRSVQALVYIATALLLHDTAGAFTLGPVGLAAALALALWLLSGRVLPEARGITVDRLVGLYGAAVGGVLAFYLFYSRGTSFETFLGRGVGLVVSLVTGISQGRESTRSVGTTVETLSETVIDILRQAAIYLEVGLMAAGAALIIAGWIWRDRLGDALVWHDGDTFHEVLVLANAAWFGALVLKPILGVTRVFLYASPLLVGLFVFIVRQTDSVAALVRRRRSGNDAGDGGGGADDSDDSGDSTATTAPRVNAQTLSTAVIIFVVVFAFINQVGLVAYAIDGDSTYTSFANTADPEGKHYRPQDMAANEWTLDHGAEVNTLSLDGVSFTMFDDDPQLDYGQLDRINEEQSLDSAVAAGCLFVRTNNVRTNVFVVRTGARSIGLSTYSLAPLEDYNTVYTTGGARVVC
jgi:hypothetical protein